MDHKGLVSVYSDSNYTDTFAVFYILIKMDIWDLLNQFVYSISPVSDNG